MADENDSTWGQLAASSRHRLVAFFGPWSNQPTWDLLPVAAVIGIHMWLVYGKHMGDIFAWIAQSQRTAIYTTGAAVLALIAGFTGTAIAQYGSSSGPIVSALRSAHGRAIRRNWLNICAWLLLASLSCLVAMVVDRASSPNGSQWIFEFAVAISMAKFGRLLFLFNLILSSLDAEISPPPTRKTARVRAPGGLD